MSISVFFLSISQTTPVVPQITKEAAKIIISKNKVAGNAVYTLPLAPKLLIMVAENEEQESKKAKG